MSRPSELRFLGDENIASLVIDRLRARDVDVACVYERGLRGRPDEELLALASAESRAVLTQDSDFGRLAVALGAPCYGIVFVRPGDLTPDEVWSLLEAFLATTIELPQPFIVVLEQSGVRVRAL